MPDIALSTMWAIGQFASLADFFTAGRSLGFNRFELNHGINSAMLAGLSLNGDITSVHEPCPADISAGTLKQRNWLVSATGEDERHQGVVSVQRSIDLAHELGAGVVIVHPGRVDIDPALETTLFSLYRAGRSSTPEYAHALDRFVAARQAQAETNMRSVRRSLLELADYATARGVRLGLENRYHCFEIPLADELEDLLSLGCGESVGYWHDVGHAEVLEHLGFGSQEDWLRRFSGQMVGIHLHDVVGIDDHRAVGLGGVDWSLIARYLPPAALHTFEFQPFNTPEQVAAALDRAQRLLVMPGSDA